MAKVLCIIGMVIAILLFVLFLVDLIVPAWMAPFGKSSMLMDITVVLAAAGLGALSYFTYKEQV